MAIVMIHLVLVMKGTMIFASEGNKCFLFSFTSYTQESCHLKIFIWSAWTLVMRKNTSVLFSYEIQGTFKHTGFKKKIKNGHSGMS